MFLEQKKTARDTTRISPLRKFILIIILEQKMTERMSLQEGKKSPNWNYVFVHDQAPCHNERSMPELVSANTTKIITRPGNRPTAPDREHLKP